MEVKRLKREIERLEEVIEAIEIGKNRGKVPEIFELAKAYASDAMYFLKKGKKDEALEAYAIAWAYIDALLHLGLIKIPERFLKLFTVEQDERTNK